MMKKISIAVLLGMFFVLTYTPTTVHACSCIARVYSPQEKLEASEAVFLGRVTSVSVNGASTQNTVTFDVDQYWKGNITKQQKIITSSSSASCGYDFTVGTQYIVYANYSDNQYTVGLCGFTAPADQVDIKSLGQGQYFSTMTGAPKFTFNRNLSFGMKGEDVRKLQQYLNAINFAVAASGAGSAGKESTYYGKATQNAVMRFQDAHKNELGIVKGTGYFGNLTRALVNK